MVRNCFMVNKIKIINRWAANTESPLLVFVVCEHVTGHWPTNVPLLLNSGVIMKWQIHSKLIEIETYPPSMSPVSSTVQSEVGIVPVVALNITLVWLKWVYTVNNIFSWKSNKLPMYPPLHFISSNLVNVILKEDTFYKYPPGSSYINTIVKLYLYCMYCVKCIFYAFTKQILVLL